MSANQRTATVNVSPSILHESRGMFTAKPGNTWKFAAAAKRRVPAGSTLECEARTLIGGFKTRSNIVTSVEDAEASGRRSSVLEYRVCVHRTEW